MKKELLLKVNAWVQDEAEKLYQGKPSEWRQFTWACKSACCFAGKVVLEAGGQFVDSTTGTTLEAGTTASCRLNGEILSIREAATRILGIDEWEAQLLFSGDNDADDINRLVQRLVKENVDERFADSD